MKHHKTGFNTPDHIQFVEYGSKQATKSRAARNRKVLYNVVSVCSVVECDH